MGQQASASRHKMLEHYQQTQDNNLLYVDFNSAIHEFESTTIQRLKETPFVNCRMLPCSQLVYADPVDVTLKDLVEPRLNTKQLFPKEQILKIMLSILSALNELKNQRGFQSYGNLSLDSIYYSKTDKSFKLINPALHSSSNYLLAKEGLKFCFLSPAQLLQLMEHEESDQSGFDSDIFVMAVCLLQVCTLTDSRSIYCGETYNILDVEVHKRLDQTFEYYGEEIAGLLKKCIEYEVASRLTINEALSLVQKIIDGENSPHQESSAKGINQEAAIMKKNKISPGSLPRKAK